MPRCKICRVERDSLTDGRCRSCQRVFEASRKGMTYGKYVDTLPKVPIAPKEEVPLEIRNKCRYCGGWIEWYQKICGRAECQNRAKIDSCERKKAREAGIETVELKPEKQCCVCGKIFRPRRNDVKYCSEECKMKNKRKRERERRQLAKMMW